MFWVIIAILAIIVGLLEDLAPFILILVIAAVIYFSYQSIKEKLEAKELKRKLDLAQNIAEYREKNSPKASISLDFSDKVAIESSFINKDVFSIIKKYQELNAENIHAKKACDAQLNHYLNIEPYDNVDDMKVHLDKHNDIIKQLKTSSDDLYKKIYSKKIQLFANSKNTSVDLKNAIEKISLSKKCHSETMDISKFLAEEKPVGLSMFQYDCLPTIFCIDNFNYCLFDELILVFDLNGNFSNALDPTALKIVVTRNHAPGSWHENIDKDSKVIKYKQTRGTYAYYASGYEYGTITFTVGKNQVSFTVSSSEALDVCERLAPKFQKKYNLSQDPIPNLLLLVNNLHKSDTTKDFIHIYERTTKYRNHFCCITNYDNKGET